MLAKLFCVSWSYTLHRDFLGKLAKSGALLLFRVWREWLEEPVLRSWLLLWPPAPDPRRTLKEAALDGIITLPLIYSWTSSWWSWVLFFGVALQQIQVLMILAYFPLLQPTTEFEAAHDYVLVVVAVDNYDDFHCCAPGCRREFDYNSYCCCSRRRIWGSSFWRHNLSPHSSCSLDDVQNLCKYAQSNIWRTRRDWHNMAINFQLNPYVL